MGKVAGLDSGMRNAGTHSRTICWKSWRRPCRKTASWKWCSPAPCCRTCFAAWAEKGHSAWYTNICLAGRSKKELIPILQQFKDISDLDLYVQRMNAMRKEIKHADTAQRRSWLIKVVEGYASLRRDLKLSWEMYRALDLIRLLDKPKELTLSRANDLLQEFSLQEEGQTPEAVSYTHLTLPTS